MEIRHHKLNRKTIIIAAAVAVVALIAAIVVGIVLKVQYDASFQDKPQITVYSNIDEYEWQYDIAATDVIQIVGQSITESSPGAPGATAEYTYTFEGQSPGKTAIRLILKSVPQGVVNERYYYEVEVRDDLKARIVRLDSVNEQFDQIFPPVELPEFNEETDTRSEDQANPTEESVEQSTEAPTENSEAQPSEPGAETSTDNTEGQPSEPAVEPTNQEPQAPAVETSE